MRNFTLHLTALLTLVVEIAANNDAVPSEILYYYQVYKMQHLTGVPATIATGCVPRDGPGMCHFDEFVEHIMAGGRFGVYEPTEADHTTTPDEDNLRAVRNALVEKTRYDVRAIFPNINFQGNAFVRMQRLQDEVLRVANAALNSGSALVDDARTAQQAVTSIIRARRRQSVVATAKWIAAAFTETQGEFVFHNNDGINWDESAAAVEADEDLTDKQKTAITDSFIDGAEDFGRNWPANSQLTVSDKNHLSIIRSLQDSVKQIGTALKRVDKVSVPIPHVPPPKRCSRFFKDDDESDSSDSSDASGIFQRKELPVRQLSPIMVSSLSDGSSPSSTASSSTSPSSSISFFSPSSLSSQLISTQPTKTGYDLALTTQFSAPTGCGGITEVATMSGVLWQNILDPAAGVTMTSCMPSQFAASVLATATTSLPPFEKLVCPSQWESYNINSTYVICCPSGFGLRAPNRKNSQRPGLKAVCTSVVWPNVLIDITSYDENGKTTIVPETVGTDGEVIFAKAFEGFTVAPVGVTSASVTLATTTSSGAIATSTSVSSAASRSSSFISSIASRTSSFVFSITTRTSNTLVAASTSSSTSMATAPASSIITSQSTISSTITSMKTTTSVVPTSLPITSLPTCGQTCWKNMLAQYQSLGCTSPDPACLCRNINFGYGLRDCSNGACGSAIGSTVIAFGSSTCSLAIASKTTLPATATATGIASLPSCGQTCMNNMIAKYSDLGCSKPDPACLCRNANFGFGIRDCSNGACGTAVASTVIAFGSSYCASATGAPKS